ncbi:MAG TPA: gamma-glutamyl-gamma-aminobutyrate hydrolase family protein [Terracidiphilus sp.]|jgi:putative glutamine amidotransferase|nr:gamma-glutamyl-gamma-aminobutyrate hydrolase family protein [Terracidiphilus sp.]
MSVRIAIPEPTSTDTEYNQRALPPYLAALHAAGLTPIVVPLHERPDRVAKLLSTVQGMLLPGSRYDVDPERYGETRHAACAPADPARTAVDELLLQDAFNLRKPILGICYGSQGLNVWRNGSLYQDLPAQIGSAVNHAPGRDVIHAHPVAVMPGSRLAALVRALAPAAEPDAVQVNSSHHQAIHTLGDNLRVAAISPVDGVVEAVELEGPDHFVLAVQWHPERTFAVSALSRAIFAAFAQAAAVWKPRTVEESVAAQ